jgi:putative transcriptional regulator
VKTLVPGYLLAMPQLGDPNFHHAVVLMLEHGDGGSMGLVVNRPLSLTLRELAKGQSMKLAEDHALLRAFSGGPVQPQNGFVLHNCAEVAEKNEVLPGLYLSVTMEALQVVLLKPEARFRFCLGYSGWGPRQLEREVVEGSWLFCEADGAHMLSHQPDLLWGDTLKGMGVDPGSLLPARGVH